MFFATLSNHFLSYLPQVLRETVCLAIREQVIQGVLLQKLSLSSEMDLVVGVAILNRNLKFVTHERLRQGMEREREREPTILILNAI